MLLSGHIAVVTGAGQGNGAAIARGLAREGAKIAIVDINRAGATTVADDIRQEGGTASVFDFDITDVASCRSAAVDIEESLGLVSILVNNAGVCPRIAVDAPEAHATFDRTMQVNLNGALNMTTAFLPALRRTKGSIINVTSIASMVSTRTSAAYSTSKGALLMLTRSLAQELASSGVRVNAIAPGAFETPMTTATRSDPERLARFLERIPMGRFGLPEELIGPAVFLAGPQSTYVTGITVTVDGGYLTL